MSSKTQERTEGGCGMEGASLQMFDIVGDY